MTPERYRQVGEIYHAALEVDADQRAAYLDHACAGDEALRREVESLLQSNAEASDFIASPALAVAAELLAETNADKLIGQTIGRYRIVSLLGAGGMGRVYLAEDKELGRQVALKFLPEFFTNQKNQVQRFRQEARAASALNHPNILTVYEVGQADGSEFIATEYIAGVTLRARLKDTAFSLREALRVTSQIADALVAAHEAGILHRDIKPENVMLRRDGYVKVLDFGLAKLTENQTGPGTSPNTSEIRTNPGVVMGTAEYMSPEQTRGMPVDARADVWSLGVILYEMVAGRRPFTGSSHGDTIVSVLEREPASLRRHAPDAPAELERIVTKALVKDPGQRYQTINQMALDLNNLRQRLEMGILISDQASVGEGPPIVSAEKRVATENNREPAALHSVSSVEYIVSEIKQHKRSAAVFAAIAIVVLLGLGYGIFRILSRPKTTAPFQTTTVTRVTSSGRGKLAAISPDGKYVVYSEGDKKEQGLWVKQVATGSTVQVVPLATGEYWGLTFSIDGDYVYYVKSEPASRGYNNLYQVPSLGGISKKILEQVDSAVAFSPDGNRLAFVRDNLKQEETQLVLANADGGNERTLATRKIPARFASDLATRIAWSPDAQTIACAGSGGDATQVVGVSVSDGSERLMTSHEWRFIGQLAWLADGSGLVMTAADLKSSTVQVWRLPLPSGEPQRITNDLNRYQDLSLTAGTGALVTVQTNRVSNIWVAPKGDATRARQITSGTANSGMAWTPNDKIVYWSNASGNFDIWIMDVDGSNQRQLTHDGQHGAPEVSPDGQYIVFAKTVADKSNIWRMDIDGGNAKELTSGRKNSNPDVSPDSRWVIYTSWDHGNGTLWRVSIDGGNPVQVTGPTTNLPVISPDGKQIACFYWDEQASPTRGAMIFPFEGGSPTRRFNIKTDQDAFTLDWSWDGRSLLYIDNVLNVWGQPINGGNPVQLTDFPGDQTFDFAYSRDGNWLAVARGRVTNDVLLITDSR